MKKFLIITTIFLSICLNSLLSKAAEFELASPNLTIAKNCPTKIDINLRLSSATEYSNAADIEILYEPTKATIIDESPAAGTQIGTGNAYQRFYGNTVNLAQKTIKLTGVTLLDTINSDKLFGFIRFESAQEGEVDFTIYYVANDTHDSNIASWFDSTDILDSVQNIKFNVIDAACNDNEGPLIIFLEPQDQDQTTNTKQPITFKLIDTLSDIDINTLELWINGVLYDINSPEVDYEIIGDQYVITFTPSTDFQVGDSVEVLVKVSDVLGNKSEGSIIFFVVEEIEDIIEDEELPITVVIEQTVDQIRDFLEKDVIVGMNLPTLTSTATAITVIAFTGISLLNILNQLRSIRLIFTIIGLLLSRKKRKLWGLVYEFATLKPIPFTIVRLYDAKGKVLHQTVTDLKGRYGFPVLKGKYELEILHNDYKTRKIPAIIQKEGLINLDIPMLAKKKTKELAIHYRIFRSLKDIIRKLRTPIVILGFLFSLVALWLQFSIINIIIFLAYILILVIRIIYIIMQPRELNKLINSKTVQAIRKRAIIKIFNRKNWQLIETQISNEQGKFGFSIEPGSYALLVAAKGYQFPSKHVTKNRLIRGKLQSLIEINTKRQKRFDEDILLDPTKTKDEKMASPF